jgi:hypothetical protein
LSWAQEALGIGGGFRRLGLIVEHDQLDLLAVDATAGVEAIDIEAQALDRRSIGACRRSGESAADADDVAVLAQRPATPAPQ